MMFRWPLRPLGLLFSKKIATKDNVFFNELWGAFINYFNTLPQIFCFITIFNSDELCFQLCVILEPMQELMSRHKAYGLNPRDCLKTTLFQKWQRMVAPPKAGKPGTGYNQYFKDSLKKELIVWTSFNWPSIIQTSIIQFVYLTSCFVWVQMLHRKGFPNLSSLIGNGDLLINKNINHKC